jgi:hypothetical protein
MLTSRNETIFRNFHTSHNASKNAVDVVYFLRLVSHQAGDPLNLLCRHLTHFRSVSRGIREMKVEESLMEYFCEKTYASP